MKAIREALYPEIESIAARAVAETGMGNVADKILKNTLAIEKNARCGRFVYRSCYW